MAGWLLFELAHLFDVSAHSVFAHGAAPVAIFKARADDCAIGQRQTALDVFDVCTAAENNFDVRPRSLQIGNHLVVERLVLVVNFDGVCADLERIGCRRNELCLIVAAVTQEVIACDLGDELDGLGVDSSSVVHDLVGVAHDVAERRAGRPTSAEQRV